MAILYYIKSLAARPHFASQMVEALKVYFSLLSNNVDFIRNKNTCFDLRNSEEGSCATLQYTDPVEFFTKQMREMLIEINTEGQLPINALVVKSKRISEQFIKEFFSIFHKCNNELAGIFDQDTLNSIFVSDRFLLEQINSFPKAISGAFL